MPTSNIPANKNFLQNVKWQFVLRRLPGLSFFVQSINIPSISFAKKDVPTPFVKLPIIGDHLDYGELTLSFKIDEDLSNYIEIHNWMVGLGFPDSFDQYRQLDNSQDKQYSDGTLTINTSAKNPNRTVTFYKMFPMFISDLQLDTSGMADEVDCTVTFAYQKYTIT